MSVVHPKTIRSLMLGTAVAGLWPATWSAPAQAQALQPVVDVCTGVSLDDSLLTDVLSTTVVPTATAVENLYDSLLSVSILGSPILTLPDVSWASHRRRPRSPAATWCRCRCSIPTATSSRPAAATLPPTATRSTPPPASR